MLRTNPTRIELKQEDLRELEEAKISWNKLSNSKRRNPEVSTEMTRGAVTKRENIRNRIGYEK